MTHFPLFIPTELQFRWKQKQANDSICSFPCKEHQAKKYDEGESCCWTCVDCIHYQVSNGDKWFDP